MVMSVAELNEFVCQRVDELRWCWVYPGNDSISSRLTDLHVSIDDLRAAA